MTVSDPTPDDPGGPSTLRGAWAAARPGVPDVVEDQLQAEVLGGLFGEPVNPTTFERFVVLTKVGSGAMGTVFAAYDPKLDRRIALKVLAQADASARARHLREARALARLVHPNVVAVHDAGESQGRLYVAMEFVEGKNLQEHIADETPDVHEVLKLLLAAGRGLAAAHRAGVVHRDFKPSNVLVGNDGRVLVADFGLARTQLCERDTAPSKDPADESATQHGDEDRVTRTGAVLGTPRYMAPEQHRGDPATAAADQYAFCVSAWEALHAQPPFLGGPGLLRRKLQGPGPSSGGVPRRVVAALRRGMAAQPSDRFDDMDALLRELSPRATKRSRWTWALTAACVVGVGGFGWAHEPETCSGSTSALEAVWGPQQRRAVEQALETGAAWDRTAATLEGYADDWRVMHAETCRATRQRGEQSEAVMDLRMGCLHRARNRLAKVVETLANADANSRLRTAEILDGLEPLARCADVEALSATVEPPRPRDATAVQQARDLILTADQQWRAGWSARALETSRQAQDVLQATDYEPAKVELELSRSKILIEQGLLDEAEAALHLALSMATRQSMRPQMSTAVVSLMDLTGSKRQRVESARQLQGLAKGLVFDARSESALAHTLANLASHEARYAEAEDGYRTAREIRQRELGPNHMSTIDSTSALGKLLVRQGRYAEAEVELRRALEGRLALRGEQHPVVAGSRHALGACLAKQGKLQDAEAQLRRAVVMHGVFSDQPTPASINARAGLAVTLKKLGRLDEAEQESRAVLSDRQAMLGPDHPRVGDAFNNLGSVLRRQKRLDDAQAAFERALEIKQAALPAGHPSIAGTLMNLASLLQVSGELEQAEPITRQAVEAMAQAAGAEHPDTLVARKNLATLLRDLGKTQEAKAEFESVLELRERVLGSDHIDVALSRYDLALLLATENDDRAALPHCERAWQQLQREDAPPLLRAQVGHLLAKLLHRQRPDQRPHAITIAEQALAHYRDLGPDASPDADSLAKWISQQRR